ncbi:Lissencephaly-1 like [Apostasia shenzhenica]|uniref:Lissencephaly-1 like n=1 Tax=Apostasia shenzhenica TaxID=1088818 RepID=A0A2I0AS44_9ASPA|nr:Lissencephaly-1 like [Apostasia shenzhenica]
MEPPECPVCLQPFEFAGGAVPRVLPCGHSACESCLSLLPRRPAAPSTIRCPACNLLVRLPDMGASALPKNIDLLRFCSPDDQSQESSSKQCANSEVNPHTFVFPLPWTEDLFAKWKDLILPAESITHESLGSSAGTFTGFLSSSSMKNGKVRLLALAASYCSSTHKSGPFHLSYIARVMDSLQRMGECGRDRLRLLVDASSMQRRGISRVFGLWMSSDDEYSRLYLVCERFDKGVLDVLGEEWRMEGTVGFSVMGLEMCEAVLRLHSESIVCGCLVLDCFLFDEYGHCILDLSSVLITGRRARGGVGGASVSDSAIFVSPEVFVSLSGIDRIGGFDGLVGYSSDVWSLACLIAMILLDDHMLGKELFQGFCSLLLNGVGGEISESFLNHYEVWKEKVLSRLEVFLLKSELESLLPVLTSCLSFQPQIRPQVKDMWCCIRSLSTKTQLGCFATVDDLHVKENFVNCFEIGEIICMRDEVNCVSTSCSINEVSDDYENVGFIGGNKNIFENLKEDKDLSKHMDGGSIKSVSLEGHHDSVTALAVGALTRSRFLCAYPTFAGGYLFSSSFDKTINVWSLQDSSLLQTLRGHEHNIMAIFVVDGAQPLCISGDRRSGIFVWRIVTLKRHELLKNWYEHNDWRYSGIQSLAVSGTSHLYTAGGDKSIKAWSLQDYSLSCIMTGHKSTVSSLALSANILYSGSWDGTIRLWSLIDYSLLSELGDNTSSTSPVMSVVVDHHIVISSYESGCIKIWMNDMFMKSIQIHGGAISALHVDSKWMCTGGWDMFVNVQEILADGLHVDIRPVASINCDSVITSLLHWNGKLFVGFSNKIKVCNLANFLFNFHIILFSHKSKLNSSQAADGIVVRLSV